DNVRECLGERDQALSDLVEARLQSWEDGPQLVEDWGETLLEGLRERRFQIVDLGLQRLGGLLDPVPAQRHRASSGTGSQEEGRKTSQETRDQAKDGRRSGKDRDHDPARAADVGQPRHHAASGLAESSEGASQSRDACPSKLPKRPASVDHPVLHPEGCVPGPDEATPPAVHRLELAQSAGDAPDGVPDAPKVVTDVQDPAREADHLDSASGKRLGDVDDGRPHTAEAVHHRLDTDELASQRLLEPRHLDVHIQVSEGVLDLVLDPLRLLAGLVPIDAKTDLDDLIRDVLELLAQLPAELGSVGHYPDGYATDFLTARTGHLRLPSSVAVAPS